MLLGRIQEFPRVASHEQTDERQQWKNRWRPKEGPELRQFAEGSHFTMHFPPVTGDGYTMENPHGPYRITPNPPNGRVNEQDGGDTFRHPPPGPDHDPGQTVKERMGPIFNKERVLRATSSFFSLQINP